MLLGCTYFSSRPQQAKSPRRRGSAVVEFAVIAPFLVAVTMGMMEVTRAVQVKNYLTDAARSGCRKAIQPGSSNSVVTDNINTILTANGITSSDATITILVAGQSVDVSTADKYDQISVRVSLPIAKVNWVTPYFFSSTAVESETLVMMHH
jgi:Flp pilus assembly protein TadG